MGRFHDRMDEDLRIPGYSPNTRECYLGHHPLSVLRGGGFLILEALPARSELGDLPWRGRSP